MVFLYLLFNLVFSAQAQTNNLKCWSESMRNNALTDGRIRINSLTAAGAPAICFFHIMQDDNFGVYTKNISLSSEGLLTITSNDKSVESRGVTATTGVHGIYILPALQEPQFNALSAKASLTLPSRNKITIDRNMNVEIEGCELTNNSNFSIRQKPVEIQSCKGRVVIDTGVGRGSSNSAIRNLSSTIIDESGNKCVVSNSVLFHFVGKEDSRIKFNTPKDLCAIIDNNCAGRLRINRDTICRVKGFEGPFMRTIMGPPERDLDKQLREKATPSTHRSPQR